MTLRLAYLAGSVVTLLLGAASISPISAARLRVCRAQEQTYEQIKPAAITLEVNAALFSAADKRCVALARRILADGASLKSRDRFGAMPLSRAAKSGDVEIVDLFLEHGADINARDLDGSTALYVAAEAGRHSAVEKLIAQRCNAFWRQFQFCSRPVRRGKKLVNDLSTVNRTREIEPVSSGNAKQPQDKTALKAD